MIRTLTLALLVGLSPRLLAQPCTPTTTFGPDGGSYVAGVLMGGAEAIDNPTSFTPGVSYQDYTYTGPGRWTRLQAGSSYFLTITAGPFVGTRYAAWIDYDGDEHFESFELVADQVSTSAGQAMLFSFTTPDILLPRVSRMRVRAAYNMATADPCANFLYGETEDYLVVLENGASCVPFTQYGSSEGDRISAISLAGESTSLNLQDAYEDRTWAGALVLDLGSNQVIQVTSGEYNDNSIAVWADWSGNGVFGDWGPELLGVATTSTAFETVSIPFTVPTDYTDVPQVRLRVRLWFGDTPNPCNTQNFGQTIDLTAAIALPSGPCPVGVGSLFPAVQIATVDLNGHLWSASPWNFSSYQMALEPGPALVRGTTQSLSTTTTTITSGFPNQTHAWMDFNGDGDFSDAGEFIGSDFGDGSFSFQLPSTTPVGHTWLRIRARGASPVDPPTDGCAFQLNTLGTMMDIRVTVQDPDGPCIPQSTFWTLFGDFIDGVELNTLSNTGTGGLAQAEYHDYTSLSTSVPIGSAQVLSIISGANATNWLGAGIDWDEDGTWEGPGEFLGVFNAGGSYSTVNIPFTVPNVSPGAKRMRVRAFPTSTAAACATAEFGETEDYTVVVETNTGIASLDAAQPKLIADGSVEGTWLLSDGSWSGASAEVLDPAGRRLWSGAITHTRQAIALPSVSSGIYTLKLQQGDRSWTGRFAQLTR